VRVNVDSCGVVLVFKVSLHWLIDFSDGHDTGIFSWGTLYELGVNYQKHWQEYLAKLEHYGWRRGEGRATDKDGKVTIRILYFIQLAKIAGKDEEEIVIPDSVTNVETLLVWLRKRGERWNEPFADGKVQVTVNRQFAEPYTLIEHGDEVAIVPRPN
jgi:molybdopterin converting factor small subunit